MSFTEKLKNKLNSIVDVRIFVPDEVGKDRMSICNSCEHLLHITMQCKKCGCFVQAKTKLANSECPIKKWTLFVDTNKQT